MLLLLLLLLIMDEGQQQYLSVNVITDMHKTDDEGNNGE